MIDLLQVCDAQSQLAGRGDVSRLPKEEILGGIVVKLVTVRRDGFRIVFPDRRRPLFPPFLFDQLQLDRVHRHRVGTNQKQPGLVDEILDWSERSAMTYLADAIQAGET